MDSASAWVSRDDAREAIGALPGSLRAGDTLCAAMQAWPAVFPAPACTVIHLAECGGDLSEGALRIAAGLEQGLFRIEGE